MKHDLGNLLTTYNTSDEQATPFKSKLEFAIGKIESLSKQDLLDTYREYLKRRDYYETQTEHIISERRKVAEEKDIIDEENEIMKNARKRISIHYKIIIVLYALSFAMYIYK